jgi:hypothetical protein
LFYFPEKKLHVNWYGQSILGAFSLYGFSTPLRSIDQSDNVRRVLTLAIIIPAIFEAKRRHYPAVIHVYLAICGHALGWAYLMPAFVGYEESFCESPYLAADHKQAKCAVQGIGIWAPNRDGS